MRLVMGLRARALLASTALVASPALVLSPAAFAQQLPSGGSVTSGAAAISQAGPGQMVINQSSAKAIINWGAFSIGQGGTVAFNNGTGATLNRVTGNVPSQIDGTLTSTGSVYLINPAGVAVGTDGRVATGGSFVASTQGITDGNFLGGGDLTFAGDSKAAVVNAGRIGSLGGDVVLIARKVENTGTLTARNGAVGLLAGYEVLVKDGQQDGGKFQVKVGGADTEAKTSGTIRAANAELRANGGNVYALAGNTKGVIAATGFANKGGRIFLTAGDGNVTVAKGATVRARQTADGKRRGGTVAVQGKTVDLAGTVAATGKDGAGGRVEVSGDLIFNTGTISAAGMDGGIVTLTGRSIVNAGGVDVSGLTGAGGHYVAKASGAYLETVGATVLADGRIAGGLASVEAARIFSSGTLSATSSSGVGGRILLTALDMDLVAARVDVSGARGGGTVLVGGDYQGGGTLAHARTLTVSPATTIKADATVAGNGGRVVLWSDETTAFYGAVSAEGGPNGGDGGLMEISSKGTLTMGGTASGAAPLGVAGTLLLDPKNIIIDDATGAFPQYELIDPNPSTGNGFGLLVSVLSTGNVVMTAPNDDLGGTNAGAVYLFNGTTGALISTLVGSTANDQVGGGSVTALTNGNYVVMSGSWDNAGVANAGAVTWGSGTTGVSGVVSITNSLVGSTVGDSVGNSGVTALANGNYVVRSSLWDDGGVNSVGAVTWGNGTTGTVGAVSASNSLVGSSDNDQIGATRLIALSNGNYVVTSLSWDNGVEVNAGAVTWGNGAGGTVGAVSSANSLVGSKTGDTVGNVGVTVLSNGNYVVASSSWDDGGITNVGAVTWGNGATGTSGAVSSANSLVGSTANDQVGSNGVVALSNGNYVVRSSFWDGPSASNAGAVTWASGTTGISGAVSSANSLVGGRANDSVGSGGVVALLNGNYVVVSANWDGASATNAGAVTWGSGTTGVIGLVSSTNSLVGSQSFDQVGYGGATALSNGNYVVNSPNWTNGGAAAAGAVTWADGTVGRTGAVSAANSLVGSTASDQVGYDGVTALTNGSYVVVSSLWNNSGASAAGAVTWGDGATGVTGVVSAANSLVGSTTNDRIGLNGVIALTNGHYVVASSQWTNGGIANAGAATWGNGTTGVTGAVSAANSLVGSTAEDRVSNDGVTALTNGNYVVLSTAWDNGSVTDAGAVTWGNGTTGTAGAVSVANSLVGSKSGDAVGIGGVTTLTNGNYVVRSILWTNGSATHAGAVTWGNGAGGTVGVVSVANSLVGGTANDQVGDNGITALADGNYLVKSASWNNGSAGFAGAVTWGNGTTGISGAVSSANSLVGTAAGDLVGAYLVMVSGTTLVTTSASGRVSVGMMDINAATGGLTFSRAEGQTVTLTAAAITSILQGGTNLALQASNDISVLSDLVASGAASLTLEAGRSILVSSTISIGGDLTLTANAPQSAGVVDAYRDAGAAVIDLSDATLNIGGTLSLTLETGAGRVNNASGDILLGAIDARALSIANLGPTAGSKLVFNGSVTTQDSQSYTGDLAVTGTDVVLNATAGTVTWTDEATASISGTAGAKITFQDGGVATRIGVMDGADAARLGIGAVSATRTYGDANPDLAAPVLTAGTLRSGDTLDDLLAPGSATVTWTGATADVSTGVGTYAYTIDGSTAAFASGKSGYFLTVTSAAPGTMEITKRVVTASLTGVTKVYDGTTSASAASTDFSLANVVNSDAVSVAAATGTYDNKNVGIGKMVSISGLTLTGAGAGNYELAVDSASGTVGTVTPRAVTVTADNGTMVQGGSVPPLTWQLTAGSLATGDALTGALTRAPGSAPGNYAILQGSLATTSNYDLTYVPGVFTITAQANPPGPHGPPGTQEIVLITLQSAPNLFVQTSAPAPSVWSASTSLPSSAGGTQSQVGGGGGDSVGYGYGCVGGSVASNCTSIPHPSNLAYGNALSFRP